MKPKFNIKDEVICKSDTTCEVHMVLGYSYNEDGYSYIVSSREIDIKKKAIVKGVSHFKEKELKLFKK